MADSIKTSFSGRLIIPLQNGEQKTTRAITIEEPTTVQASIDNALANLSDWLRGSTIPSIKYVIQPSNWRDYDPIAATVGGGTDGSELTWSLSAADPFIFEVTDKTVRSYSENYGLVITED